MKKIFLALSLFLLNYCKSQNNIMDTPIIDGNFEKFDDNMLIKYPKNNFGDIKTFLPDGNYLEITKTQNGIYYVETLSDSYFLIYKLYFNNGNIKLKGLGFNGEAFQKGIWYEFDEQGNLIKEIDYDKPFKFTFEDIVKFCERENIPLTKGPIMQSTGFHTTIRRSVENNKAIWRIEWLKKPDIIEKILLDGVTGEVISKKDMKYINN